MEYRPLGLRSRMILGCLGTQERYLEQIAIELETGCSDADEICQGFYGTFYRRAQALSVGVL